MYFPIEEAWRQRPPHLRINRRNPIAKDMRMVVVPNAKTNRDLIKNQTATLNGTHIFLPSFGNLSDNFGSSDSDYDVLANIDNRFDIANGAQFTFLSLCAASTQADHQYLGNLKKDSSNYIDLRINKNSAGTPNTFNCFLQGSGSTVFAATHSANLVTGTSQKFFYCVSVDLNSTIVSYLNSERVIATPSGSINDTISSNLVTTDALGANAWDGDIALRCWWTRALNDAEITSLRANPSQLFEPDVSYYALVSGGGTTASQVATKNINITPKAATVNASKNINAAAQNINISAYQASVTQGTNINATAQNINISAYQASIRTEVESRISAILANLNITPKNATINTAKNIVATSVNNNLTAYQSTISAGTNVSATKVNMNIQPKNSIVNAGKNINAGLVNANIQGKDSSVTLGSTINATSVNNNLTAYQSNVTNSKNVNATKQNIGISTYQGSVNAVKHIYATAKNIGITAYNADVNATKQILSLLANSSILGEQGSVTFNTNISATLANINISASVSLVSLGVIVPDVIIKIMAEGRNIKVPGEGRNIKVH